MPCATLRSVCVVACVPLRERLVSEGYALSNFAKRRTCIYHPFGGRCLEPCLTRLALGFNLEKMRFGKATFVAALAVALTAYAFDCGGMTTPQQAMQCCKSMPCSSRGHRGQDCCKTMPAMRSPFVQSPSVYGTGFSLNAMAVLPASGESQVKTLPARSVVAQCHAPPLSDSRISTPLRI